MSQSLSKLYTHIVFHTKYNRDVIKADIEKELFAYFGGILKENKSVPIAINGIENHVHILCIMSKNIALADLLEELKRNSSRWIKSKGVEYSDFAWQGGYGGVWHPARAGVHLPVVEHVHPGLFCRRCHPRLG